jgi:hypothetical protein
VTRRLAALGLALGLCACAGGTFPRPAPGPAAPLPPARGYEAVTPHGVELEFDAARQTYQVRSQPGVFWLDGRFFRRAGPGWEASERLDGPWTACAADDLPAGLR